MKENYKSRWNGNKKFNESIAISSEMKKVLDDYFGDSNVSRGEYPVPYSGFVGNRSSTVRRDEVEREITSGELDKHPAVADSINQIRTRGKVLTNYFPWIIQRAKELMKENYKSRMRALAESILKENCCGCCPSPLVSPIDVMRKLQQELGQGVAVSVNLINNIQVGDVYVAHVNLEKDAMPKKIDVACYTLEMTDAENAPHYYTYKVITNE